MSLRRDVKREARERLQGHHGGAIGVLAITVAVAAAVSLGDSAFFYLLGYRFPAQGREALAVTAATAGAWVLLLAPLSVGVWHWYDGLAKGRPEAPGTIFQVYEGADYGRALWMKVLMGLSVGGVAALLFVMPAAALYFGLDYRRWSVIPSAAATVLLVVALVLVPVWLLLLWVFGQRYAAAPLTLLEGKATAREALRASVDCTRGHRWALVGLDISFLPWFFLCLAVVPVLYVVPYYTMTRVLYCHRLMEQFWEDDNEKENKTDD